MDSKTRNRYGFIFIRLLYGHRLLTGTLINAILTFISSMWLFLPILYALSIILWSILLKDFMPVLSLLTVLAMIGSVVLGSLLMIFTASVFDYKTGLSEKTAKRDYKRHGSAYRYAFHSALTSLIAPITAGFLIPLRTMYLQRKITENIRIGGTKLNYSAKPFRLFLPYLPLWAGTAFLFVAFAFTIQSLMFLILSQPMLDELETKHSEEIKIWVQSLLFVLELTPFIAVATIVLLFTYIRTSVNHFVSALSLKNLQFKLRLPFWKTVGFTIGFAFYYATLGLLLPGLPRRASRFFIRNLEVREG